MRPVRSSTASTRPSRAAASSRSAANPNAEPPAPSIKAMVSSMVPGSARGRPRPDGLRGCVTSCRHRHGGALGGQPLGDRAADAPAAASHQSRFTGEQFAHRSSKSSSIGRPVLMPEVDQSVRRGHHYSARTGAVVGVRIGRVAPYRARHRLVDLGDVVLVGPPGDLHGGRAAHSHQLQAFDDVVRQHFHREVGAGAVPGAVVGRRVDEQIGEARDGAAAVGARAVAPLVGQLGTAAAANVDGGQEIQVVAGGVDDDIEVDLPAVLGDNAFRVDPRPVRWLPRRRGHASAPHSSHPDRG